MADGAYERRGPREAELARIRNTIARIRAKVDVAKDCALDAVGKADVEPVKRAEDRPEGKSGQKGV